MNMTLKAAFAFVLFTLCLTPGASRPSLIRVTQLDVPGPGLEPACETKTFTGVSPEIWTCFKNAVSLQMGFKFPETDSGRVSGDADVDFKFSRTPQKLDITASNLPFLVSCKKMNERIGEFLEDCRGPQITPLQNGQSGWRIDGPNVKQLDTPYPSVTLVPGDTVKIAAGGCVQTGGHGPTWKLYVDPKGANSRFFYHGLIKFPGMPASIRIRKFLDSGSSYVVRAAPDMALHLGYEDGPRDYANNGYWGHDDGTENQCKGVGKAWVEITIAPAQR